jgi:hypothetical protein
MNIYGLIRNIRLMGATRPDNKKLARSLVEQLTKFVTDHDEQRAKWTLDYARLIKLVQTEGEAVFLVGQHSFVRQLDQRERSTCQALAKLVKNLVRYGSDGWVPRYIAVQKMENDIQFGYSRGEHEYWIDQTIFRLRLLERQKKHTKGRIQEFIRAVL